MVYARGVVVGASMDARAPMALKLDLGVSPVTTSATRGSMAPNLAMVALLDVF